MKTLMFKCRLLSDVILNRKSATEGNRETLDFIPGNNFLGIVAAKLYNEELDKEKARILFHSKDVCFGDGHPAKGNNRSLKIPASMFYPKMQSLAKICYIYHMIPDLSSDDIKKKQLKQCRNGFYCFENEKANGAFVGKSFAIKSAYDKENRRSKDKQMYGYESLNRGMEFFFEVVINNKATKYEKEIIDSLVGVKRVGRSRTAQYGLVEISEYRYEEPQCASTFFELNGKKCVSVYADGRLIFLDDYGVPTFQPSAEDLGIIGGKILWEKSQIRTFQYAPWNFKRMIYDADRCGIEKGSVFIVELYDNNVYPKSSSNYIGFYQNEGFGKVLYNPSFLEADFTTGVAIYKIQETQKNISKSDDLKKEIIVTPLLEYLEECKQSEDEQFKTYEMVNRFVDDNEKKFEDNTFASQWGTIRSIAMKYKTDGEIINELFDKQSFDGKPVAYLTHGVASEKWKQNGRLAILRGFVEKVPYGKLQETIINLASEMAKVCKKNDHYGKG